MADYNIVNVIIILSLVFLCFTLIKIFRFVISQPRYYRVRIILCPDGKYWIEEKRFYCNHRNNISYWEDWSYASLISFDNIEDARERAKELLKENFDFIPHDMKIKVVK
jgi:hypothetical protein